MELRLNTLRFPGGNTNTFQGLQRMREIFRGPGNRPPVPNVALVITDGQPTLSVGQTQPEAQAAQNEGIGMYSLGITNSVNEATLRYLSSQPRQRDRNYFISPGFDQTRRRLVDVLSAVCNFTGGRTGNFVVLIACTEVFQS